MGQIKTVAPDAYIFRQEKNVGTQENKKGYALTIEADLNKEGMCIFKQSCNLYLKCEKDTFCV